MSSLDRRQFTRLCATSTGAGLGWHALAAQPQPAAAQVVAPPTADDEHTPAAGLEPADLVLELVRQMYPDRLDGPEGREHLAAIRGQIERHLARSASLRAFPLSNADEPATTFVAYRSEQGLPPID